MVLNILIVILVFMFYEIIVNLLTNIIYKIFIIKKYKAIVMNICMILLMKNHVWSKNFNIMLKMSY